MTNQETVQDKHEFRYSITNNISYMYQVYCSYMLVYKNSELRTGFLTPETLQSSLTALVRKHYQPISGWFNINSDEIDVVFRNNKFNDPPFETQVLPMNYEEIMERVHASDIELLVPKGPSGLISKDNQVIPMVLVKATYLESNEAVVIGITYHHSLMDGSTFWLFMYNWANLCKQMISGENRNIDEYTLPCPPSFGFPSISHLREPDTTFDHNEYTLVDAAKCLREFIPGNDIIKESILHISIEQQREIRVLAKQHGVSFTSMLCAMFWRETSILRLAAKPSIGTLNSLFTCAVNPRASLGISSDVCASPVVNLAATKTIDELVTTLDLHSTAQLIHQTITKGSAAYISSSMDFLLKQRRTELEDERSGSMDGKKAMLSYVCPVEAKCTVSSSRNFPIYQTDFGFGSPVYVRPPYLPFEGCLRIWPTPQSPGDGLANKEAPLEIYLSQPDYINLSLSPILRPFIVDPSSK
ncbi:hypothetical protein LPJ66_005869 [Kickxella alabastrina]|uniref:Uncharacterized protein n=1 Tax=Kickxella alabastrina TaxID=61397 RepID=A0ACC1ILP8_9FUNG|nr:hypothetical protein LPJ66_005869 [Kickxella alabastrina]